MVGFPLSSIISKTAAGLTHGFSIEQTIGRVRVSGNEKVEVQLRLPFIVSMLEHRPSVARYSGFSRTIKSGFLCVIFPTHKKNIKA